MTRTNAILPVSATLIVVSSFLTAMGSAQSIPGEIQAALEECASLDPISVHWEGLSVWYTFEPTMTLSVTSSYSRQGKCFYWMHATDEVGKGDGGFSFEQTCRFDGDVVSATHGNIDASWYKIAKLNETQPKTSRFQLHYFDAVGIFYPTQQEDLPEGVLQSNILYLIQNGGELVSCGEAQLEQEAVVRIEITAGNPAWEEFVESEDNIVQYQRGLLRDRLISQGEFGQTVKAIENRKTSMPQTLRWVYYLSPEHRYAVRKHERFTVDGKLTTSYSNSSFRPIPGTDIVLAQAMNGSLFENIGEVSYDLLSTPAYTIDLSVVKISTEEIPKEEFVLNMKDVTPGATVIDAAAPGLQRKDGTVRTFIMPASPDALDEAIARATGKYEGPGRSNGARNLFRYGCIPLGVVLILVACYRIYSARRKALKG